MESRMQRIGPINIETSGSLFPKSETVITKGAMGGTTSSYFEIWTANLSFIQVSLSLSLEVNISLMS